MNLHSMTGYALARRDTPAGAVVLELRSVNSRFLDLQFRVSDELRAGEGLVREALTAQLSRGKLDCRLYIQRNSQTGTSLQLAAGVVEQLARLDASVRERLPGAVTLSVGEVLRWPGVLEERDLSAKQVVQTCKLLAVEALAQLLEARAREGDKLHAMLLERVERMEAIATRLAPLVPQLVAAHQQKLIERLEQALGLANTAAAALSRAEAADRIRQEVTLYGVRIDVAEELSRLSAHLTETRHILAKGGAAGKRLDFMMQELNREANTLGSKAAAAELADAAMELKLLIEQMREQVQNLE
jgi:uncharacterized protein (TIGR00255 family)